MIKKIIASKLRDKEVIGINGKKIGNLFDISINETDGKILGIIVTPKNQEIESFFQTDRDKKIIVPYSAINTFSELIVIDERRIPRKAKLNQ